MATAVMLAHDPPSFGVKRMDFRIVAPEFDIYKVAAERQARGLELGMVAHVSGRNTAISPGIAAGLQPGLNRARERRGASNS